MKIIIIGGGLAGLSAGVFAQQHGFQSTIYEKHSLPGGVCTSWKRNGFLIDGCIHWLMGSRAGTPLFQLYSELGVFESTHLKRLDHFCRFIHQTPDHRKTLDLTSDLNQLEASLRQTAPEDDHAITELLRGVRDFQDFNADWSDATAGVLSRMKFFYAIRHQAKYFGRYEMPVTEYVQRFKNPFLRWALTQTFVPEMPAFFLFMLLGQLTSGALGFIEEGSMSFALAIEKRYKALGGEIRYEAPVERILVENSSGKKFRAAGVILADGTRHSADAVISACDGHTTLFKMLEGQFITPQLQSIYQQWPLFPPILLVSFGVRRRFEGPASTHTILLNTPIEIAGAQHPEISYKIFNGNPKFAPEGKSVIQAMITTDYDSWTRLREDPRAYEAAKKRAAEAVLECLEQFYPDLRAQVEMTDVATPCTFFRYTGNYRGAWEGWLMTPAAFKTQIPKTLPGLANFYMTGQWVEPGGGVPTVLLSGRNVIRKLVKD